MQEPVFVVGPPRCGTTLTARILGRHPAIFMPGETHFFPDIYARRAQLGEPRDAAARAAVLERLMTLYGRYNEPEDQARVERLFAGAARAELEQAADYRTLFARFMERQTEAAGKRRWGNQAPADLFHVTDILAFYPRARFVLCVRDARDFLVSYRDKWKNTAPEHVERLRKLYHPVVSSLLWRASVRRAAALEHSVPAGQLYTLRYEDLAHDPEAAVRRLCAFVGEEFDPAMLEVRTHNSSAARTGSGIFSSSVGRWREDLAAEDAYLAQRINRAELERWGYAVEHVRAPQWRVAARMASAPAALWRGLQANKGRRGPLLPYLRRRAGALLARA